MTESIFSRLKNSKSVDFEKTVTEITTTVLEEPDLDPILRLLLAERLLKLGSEGSTYIAASSEKILDEIANAGIPRLTNWVDFQDREIKKQRDNATAFLERSSKDIAAALQNAEMNRDGSKTSRIGPAIRWVGWLSKDEHSDWRVSMKANPSHADGTRMCMFRKSTPTAPPEMIEIGQLSPEGIIALSEQFNTTSPIEGRPVFQILDAE